MRSSKASRTAVGPRKFYWEIGGAGGPAGATGGMAAPEAVTAGGAGGWGGGAGAGGARRARGRLGRALAVVAEAGGAGVTGGTGSGRNGVGSLPPLSLGASTLAVSDLSASGLSASGLSASVWPSRAWSHQPAWRRQAFRPRSCRHLPWRSRAWLLLPWPPRRTSAAPQDRACRACPASAWRPSCCPSRPARAPGHRRAWRHRASGPDVPAVCRRGRGVRPRLAAAHRRPASRPLARRSRILPAAKAVKLIRLAIGPGSLLLGALGLIRLSADPWPDSACRWRRSRPGRRPAPRPCRCWWYNAGAG